MPAVAAAITPRTDVMVQDDVVMLSDMFMNIPAAADKPIFQSPAYGQRATLNSRQLAYLAWQHGLAWRPAHALVKLVIIRDSLKLSSPDLAQAVQLEAAKTLAGKADAVMVALDNTGQQIFLPHNAEPKLSVEDFRLLPDERFTAVVKIDAMPLAAAELPQHIEVAGRLVLQRRVPVLTRRLETGSAIETQDVDYALLPERQLQADVILDVAALEGAELRRVMSAGQPLRSADLRPKRMVVKNELVEILFRQGGLELTTQGRALEDGALGDVVSVLNLQSRTRITGRVSATGQISVMPLQRIAMAKPISANEGAVQ